METTRFDLGTYGDGSRWAQEVPADAMPTPGSQYVCVTEADAWRWLDGSAVNGNRMYRLAVNSEVRHA